MRLAYSADLGVFQPPPLFSAKPSSGLHAFIYSVNKPWEQWVEPPLSPEPILRADAGFFLPFAPGQTSTVTNMGV